MALTKVKSWRVVEELTERLPETDKWVVVAAVKVALPLKMLVPVQVLLVEKSKPI